MHLCCVGRDVSATIEASLAVGISKKRLPRSYVARIRAASPSPPRFFAWSCCAVLWSAALHLDVGLCAGLPQGWRLCLSGLGTASSAAHTACYTNSATPLIHSLMSWPGLGPP